jgi:hypothetical protein
MSCKLDQVPDWARSWCYYFAAMAFVTMLAGVLTLFMSRKLGLATVILSLFAALIQAATGMTLFYMCRTSLMNSVSHNTSMWNTSPDQGVKHQLLTMFG